MTSVWRLVVRVAKLLVVGTAVVFLSWMACAGEWPRGPRPRAGDRTTMKTIVAYSEAKRAEMERPSPVACDQLPDYPYVPHINRTWSQSEAPNQESAWQYVPGTSVSLYAAFYDERSTQRYIRILAMFHGRNFSSEEPLFCQTRSQAYEDSVEVVAAKPMEIWWHSWDGISTEVQTPLLLSCPLTEPLFGPSVVSVVTQPCDKPTNAFPLEPSQQKQKYKRTFTICVKDMNFEHDVSQNLLEWIETNKILGVEMIDVYINKIAKESENVLLYYVRQGYVRLFYAPIRNKPERSLWQRRRDHIVTYNDCLYRNIGDSEFIVPLDVDEIVLPKIAHTWPELLKRLKNLGWSAERDSAILFRNVFFFDFLQDVNKYNFKQNSIDNSRVYVKRDDVRIAPSIINFNDIGKEDDDSVSNEVIDLYEEEIRKKYKLHCGRDLGDIKVLSHVVRSAKVSQVGSYSKSFMATSKVLTAFNHYPLMGIRDPLVAGPDNWPAPLIEVQLNHYKESCNDTILGECAVYTQRARIDRSARKLRAPLLRALSQTSQIIC